jgi:hypothetical protein
MLACTALASVYATADTAFSISVWAGKTAVDAYFVKTISVFFSEIFA